MGTRTVALVLVVLTVLATASRADTTVNAAIGDASWIAAHGRVPDGSVDEIARIRTHLAYVITELRRRGVAASKQRARDAALVALEHYTDRGMFPRRTDDRFAGRRPRFIDDRGVRCAVGELIAQSGHAELARSIDAEYEYAFVRDMKSPALARWADANGFTLDELAMIQPSYVARPTEESTRRSIEEITDDITVACASESPPLDTLSLHVIGVDSGRVQVETTSTAPFARCFAERASSGGGGAYNTPTHQFDFTMELALKPPQQLFDGALAGATSSNNCTPRPGAIARRASYDVTSDEHGLAIQVTTTPSNAEVATCLEDELRVKLRRFGAGVWKLHARSEVTLACAFDPVRFHQLILQYASGHATECYPTDGGPARVKVSVGAHVDHAKFAIVVDAANQPFATCLATKLQASLRDAYKVSRKRPDGTYERYFRIDREIATTIDIPVETPKARAERSAKMRQDFERRRKHQNPYR